MNRTLIGVVGTALALALIIWLLAGTKISCRQGFFDKDKQVIEITHE